MLTHNVGTALAMDAIDHALSLLQEYRKGIIARFKIKPSALYEILAVYLMMWAVFRPDDEEKKSAYHGMVDAIVVYIRKNERDPNEFLVILRERIIEAPLHAGDSDYNVFVQIARSMIRRMKVGDPNDAAIIAHIVSNLMSYGDTIEAKWIAVRKV